MIQRAGVQPESFRRVTPGFVDGPLQEPSAKPLADEVGHQPGLHQLDFIRLPAIQLGKAGGRTIDVQDVQLLPWVNLVAREQRPLGSFLGAIVGTCGGILLLAYERDQERFPARMTYGVLIGIIVGSGLLPALVGSLELMPRTPRELKHEEPGGSEGGDEDDGDDDILPMKPSSRRRR